MKSREKRPADPQVARFVDTARALGCDEDKARFEAQLGVIARPGVAAKKKTAPSPRKGNPNKPFSSEPD